MRRFFSNKAIKIVIIPIVTIKYNNEINYINYSN